MSLRAELGAPPGARYSSVAWSPEREAEAYRRVQAIADIIISSATLEFELGGQLADRGLAPLRRLLYRRGGKLAGDACSPERVSAIYRLVEKTPKGPDRVYRSFGGVPAPARARGRQKAAPETPAPARPAVERSPGRPPEALGHELLIGIEENREPKVEGARPQPAAAWPAAPQRPQTSAGPEPQGPDLGQKR